MRAAFGLIVLVVGLMACKLEPPPAAPEEAPPPSDEPPPSGPMPEPAPPPKVEGDTGSNLEALLAAPTCDVAVVGILKANRSFWDGAWKISCTYEIEINSARYKYTRLMPRDRKGEPDDVCDKGRGEMESVVRSATEECKNLQVTNRKGDGLVRIR